MKKFLSVVKTCGLGLLIGVLGGAVGAAFARLLSFVTGVREGSPWMLLLLPIGGITTVLLYRISRMSDFGGTNEIIRGLDNKNSIRPIAAPLIFVSTAITHLFGGSAGREGAALQLGGAGASAVAGIFRLKDEERTVFIMSGMSAVFAGVFGTPLTAAVFMLEFRSNKKLFPLAILPCFISAISSKIISSFMGVTAETATLSEIASYNDYSLLRVLALTLGLALVAHLMCFTFHGLEHLAKKLISNPFIRVLIGSVVIVTLTAIVGDMRYNGSGMEMALGAVVGEADWFDFLLKMTFTAITLAAGLKGGEIVPTFCIGATFGCVFGSLLGLDGGFAACLGLIGLFCAVANSPVAAIFLGIELFGVSALPYYILVCLVLWPLSVNKGLFENRFFVSPIGLKNKNRN